MPRKVIDLCSEPGCHLLARPRSFQCRRHRWAEPRKLPKQEQPFTWEFGCLMCGRVITGPDNADLKLTEAQAKAYRPQRCSACGGRMLLIQTDVGTLGPKMAQSA